jgi:hypothetical protein
MFCSRHNTSATELQQSCNRAATELQQSMQLLVKQVTASECFALRHNTFVFYCSGDFFFLPAVDESLIFPSLLLLSLYAPFPPLFTPLRLTTFRFLKAHAGQCRRWPPLHPFILCCEKAQSSSSPSSSSRAPYWAL